VQVDVSQTGVVTAGLLAMFRKLGSDVRTVVAPAVLDAAASGAVEATALAWQGPLKGRVGNSAAAFYTIDLSQAEIDKVRRSLRFELV
jgi:hypothetical protein